MYFMFIMYIHIYEYEYYQSYNKSHWLIQGDDIRLIIFPHYNSIMNNIKNIKI